MTDLEQVKAALRVWDFTLSAVSTYEHRIGIRCRCSGGEGREEGGYEDEEMHGGLCMG